MQTLTPVRNKVVKFTDYIIVFIITFSCFAVLAFYGINTSTKTSEANTEYANMLTVACNDAMKATNTEHIEDGIWKTEAARRNTLSTFYSTLAFCFNNEYTKEEANHIYTPIACLIDTDGYYISYNSSFDNTGNVYIDSYASGNEYSKWMPSSVAHTTLYDTQAFISGMTVSSLNTWNEMVDDCIIRFYLTNKVSVTMPDGVIITDTRERVLKKIRDLITDGVYGVDVLNKMTSHAGTNYTLGQLLSDYDTYDKERSYYIVDKINKEVEFYINFNNPYARNDQTYEYVMPEIRGEDWHRLLENPTVISFLQGKDMSTGVQLSNVYALAGGELTKSLKYIITRDHDAAGNEIFTYHYLDNKNCKYYNIVKTSTIIDIVYNGGRYSGHSEYNNEVKTDSIKAVSKLDGSEQIINKIYDSMEECAFLGAYPCDCAINHN